MKRQRRHRDQRVGSSLRRIVRFLLAAMTVLCFCCAYFVPVLAQPNDEEVQALTTEPEEETITVSFTFCEMISNTRYFNRELFVLPVDADLQTLLAAAAERGLLREYVFEEELLTSIVFANGVTLTAGAFGSESGYDITEKNRSRLPFADFTLEDQTHYLLNYRANQEVQVSQSLQTADVRDESLWNDSLDAMLDSACSWLYHNRTRGSSDAVMALGVANRSANPTDVVLLTQLEGLDLSDLSSQVSYFSALAYCGFSPPIDQNKLLFTGFINFADPENCTTAELCDVLRFCDSFSFSVDSGARLSQNAIIGELLLRQNKDGGFSQNREGSSGIRTTASVISVLQNYRDLEVVQNAMLGGISYLSSPAVRDLLFQENGYTDCLTVSKMILAICICELPIQDIYFIYNGKTYVDLLQECFCVSGGFSMRAGEQADEIATAAAIEALCALQMSGDPYLREEASLISFTVDTKEEESAEVLASPNEEQPPARQIPSGFWLAAAFTVSMILVEVVHYIIYRHQVNKME